MKLAERRTRLIASLIYLRYSKRRYLKFYRVFNRFAMKCFLHEALMFWGYAAAQCIIDNTNLARLRGAGSRAVIVPEMNAFSKRYGFQFVCHAIDHPNRKAGNERSFWSVETSFLPGRTFASLEDLNEQARRWATERMEHRPLTKMRVIPARLFEHERLYLNPLPEHLPAPHQTHHRVTDQYGYVAFDANDYWVPGTRRDDVKVLQYADCLKIFRHCDCLAEYPLPPDGTRHQHYSPPGEPKPRHQPKNRHRHAKLEEQRLRAMGDEVSAYLDFALSAPGVQRHRFTRELFALSRKLTSEVSRKTAHRAHRYRTVDLATLRRIAWLCLSQEEEVLPEPEVDEDFRQRPACPVGARREPTGEFSSAVAGVWFLTMAFLLVGAVLTTSYVRASGEADSSSQDDPNSHIAEPPKEPAIERMNLPRLEVHVLDKDHQPVPGRSVLLSDRHHGVPINFELVSKRSDENGWADLGVLPQDNVCVQVSGGPHTLRNGQARTLSEGYAMIYRDGEGRFQHTLPENPMAKLTFDRETNALVITFAMRQAFNLQFQGVDAKTGKDVFFAGVFYKDLQRKRWWYPAMMDGSGTQHNFSPITSELSDSPFRLASSGYYPADFQLDEKLELGKQYIQRVELIPASDIRFTVLTPEGAAAENARFRWINPKGLSNMGLGKTTTDTNGVLVTDYPAQGELTIFKITHEPGEAVVAVKNLPEPVTVAENGESRDVISCEVRLPRDDAIRAVLLPGEFKYGKQSLTVHATNDSSMTQFLARGDYLHEILVDGVTYRMARFDIGWYPAVTVRVLHWSREKTQLALQGVRYVSRTTGQCGPLTTLDRIAHLSRQHR